VGTASAQSQYAFDVGPGWYGPGGVGHYKALHGNTPEVLRIAHEIRAGRFDNSLGDAIDSGEAYDLVVVGGGFSDLSARLLRVGAEKAGATLSAPSSDVVLHGFAYSHSAVTVTAAVCEADSGADSHADNRLQA